MALEPGTRIGPYEILGLLGAGGMGEVYRARDERLDRKVAIKVLLAAAARDSDRRQRFEREAQAVGATRPWRALPPTRRIEILELGKEELGKEKTVIRGPIPVICVPRRGRDPGHGAVSSRAGPARASPAPESASPAT